MIKIITLRSRYGQDEFDINADMIEAIFEREGNTSEIRLSNGRTYTCIESRETIKKLLKIGELTESIRNRQ